MDTFAAAELMGLTANAFRVAVFRSTVQPVGYASFGAGRPRALYRVSDVEALIATRRKPQRVSTASR